VDTIYADNNATTMTAPEVKEAIAPYLGEHYFNPSSMYEAAQEPADALERSRAVVARVLGGVDPDEVLFTSCATESNNAAIFGIVRGNRERRHIITTAVEHPAVLEVCKDLEQDGYDVTYLPVKRNGELEIEEFVRALSPDTLLVSIMHANNETGVMFPVEELARITKETEPSIVFHTDATQTMGKLPIDLTGEFRNVDLLSFSGHKLHAPKGVGVLYVRKGTPLRPFMIGGHQEGGKRGGTENVPYIVGLARALEIVTGNAAEEEERIARLRDHLESEIEKRIPYVEVNGRGAPRLPNTLNIACHFVEGEAILYRLSEHGICASSGSACTSGSLDPSHVLMAMDVPFTAVHGSVRFSFSRYTTESEVERIIEVFPEVIESLRRISPYWDAEKRQPRSGVLEQ